MKNHLRSLLLVFGFSFVASSFTTSVEGREWTSTDGKKMKAIFLGIEGEKYKFKLANGQEARVAPDRFIKADQEAAKRLALIGDDSYTVASARQIDGLLAKQLKANGFSSFNEPLPDDLLCAASISTLPAEFRHVKSFSNLPKAAAKTSVRH